MGGKYLLTTLGCKVNQYESQHLRETLESLGLRPTPQGDDADIAVVNTCAVTGGASRKNRQAIRRATRDGRTPVVVVGCGASADSDRLRRIPGVIAVLGHEVDVRAEIHSLLTDQVGISSPRQPGATSTPTPRNTRLDAARNDLWMKADAHGPDSAAASGIKYVKNSSTRLPLVKPTSELTARIESFAGHQRAFLKVQDGCDAFCSYCIIPRLRSQLKSKPIDVAVAEAETLVRAGHREIIVTGIFLGAYGRHTAIRKRWAEGRSPLAELVGALARVPGLARLRLSSLEPGDVDEALLEVLASHDTCVPHLHLPLQSGSGSVLRRMNRQYTREAFVDMVDRVRAALDRPAISTDIIVGFPGETKRDFEASLEVARYAGFCKIHAFPFSPREQTAAKRWQKQFVPPPVARERMQRLAEAERECSLAFRGRFVGQFERVIVERPHDGIIAPTSPGEIHHGRSDRYFEIHFEGPQAPNTSLGGMNGRPPDGPVSPPCDVRPGDLVTVRVDRVTPTRTHGTLVRADESRVSLPVLSSVSS